MLRFVIASPSSSIAWLLGSRLPKPLGLHGQACSVRRKIGRVVGIVDLGRRRAGDASRGGEVVAALEDQAVALPHPAHGDLGAGILHLLIFAGLVRRLVSGVDPTGTRSKRGGKRRCPSRGEWL